MRIAVYHMAPVDIPASLKRLEAEAATLQASFSRDRLIIRADKLASKVEANSLPIRARLAIEEAACLLAETLVTPEAAPDSKFFITIELPKNLASKYPPDNERHDVPPHVTLLVFQSKGEATPGKTDEVVSALRKLTARIAPFRCNIQAHKGLQDFGDGPTGSKALWFPVTDDPNGQLAALHNLLKRELALLDLDMTQKFDYNPHSTWSYVDNNQSEKDRQRMSNLASNRFTENSTWFDVRTLTLSLPNKKKVPIPLSPNLRPDKR